MTETTTSEDRASLLQNAQSLHDYWRTEFPPGTFMDAILSMLQRLIELNRE